MARTRCRVESANGNTQAALDALGLAERGILGTNHRAYITHGYGVLGRPDEALRAFEELQEVAEQRYVDASVWAHAYAGIGRYDEAKRLLDEVSSNPELLQFPFVVIVLARNAWSDPVLEEPEWVELRNRFMPG